MEDTHASPNPFLVYHVYGQALKPRWLTSILTHGAGVAQGDYHRGTCEGLAHILHRRGERTRWELHLSGTMTDLPQGKAWDCPDWSNGAIRVWDTSMQITGPKPSPSRPQSPSPGEDPRKQRWH